MRRVETAELKRMLDRDEDFVLVNVLAPEMFEQEHIPGSHNVPATDRDLVSEIERLAGSKDRRVVVYCSSPRCQASPAVAHRLEHAGFSNVLHYAGGMEQWKAAGYDVAHGASAPTG